MNKRGRGLLGDGAYQLSRLCCFRQENYFSFSYISQCKTCDPGAEPFLTSGVKFEQTW